MKKQDIKLLERAARVLRVLAHPMRLEIVRILKDKKEVSVHELQAALEASQSMTSQHLAALKNVGIVSFRKESNVCHYYLQNRNVLKVLNCIKESCKVSE
ncbi:MAG: helix-turn-helix transcriptional regulator [Candidatus Omnitrophica bacterium]|nr:helix-turn-helix transcriptional regulator [Candidatus Omnitrophota bacterium]